MTNFHNGEEAYRLAAWLQEGAWHQMTLGDVEKAGRLLIKLQERLVSLEKEYDESMVHQNNQYKRRVDERDALQKELKQWIEKHDALLDQQLSSPQPPAWNATNVIEWCIDHGIKAAQNEPGVKMVPIRQLFDHEGNQVCNLGSEMCHFYVLPTSGGLCGASCNHCQRGIPDNKPHRLCPVIHESTK